MSKEDPSPLTTFAFLDFHHNTEGGWTTGKLNVDWVLVRKYALPEPTTTIGLEERFAPAITATVNIDPDTLNLKSNGEWITAYIELPAGHGVDDIDVSSVKVNGTISADSSAPTQIGDYDNDDILDLMVKFDRASVIAWLSTIDYSQDTGKSRLATLEITGKVSNLLFRGFDSVRILS